MYLTKLVAKLEFFNPGGSMKDRVGKRTVMDLEKKGEIEPGYTLIEATSGNCGIGMSLIGAIKGYKVIITMTDKMSIEKTWILNSLGAEVIRTPNDAAYSSKESFLGVAKNLGEVLPKARFLDQYSDESNSLVNYDELAEEIWWQMEGNVDCVVMTCGTGGSITGVGRKLKEKNPNIKVFYL